MGATLLIVMVSDKPSSPMLTLGDFFLFAFQEANSDGEGAPPLLNDRHFPNLGGGRGGVVSQGRAGCGNRAHHSRSRRPEAST